MTRHGVVTSAAGVVPFGHLGWGYRDRDEFLDRTAEYIADGLANNQWVEYVAMGTREQLRTELAGMGGLADVSEVKVTPIREFFALPADSDVLDPAAALAGCAAAVQKALEAGYSGLRIIVDATSASRTAEQRDALARFEFLVDQKLAALPVAALCAYDIEQFPEASALVCLHPLVNRKTPHFQLYAQSGADFALGGELDSANERVFRTALQRIWPLTSGDLVVDVGDLQFISHQQLLALDAYARANDAKVTLRRPQMILARVSGLLDLTNVRLE